MYYCFTELQTKPADAAHERRAIWVFTILAKRNDGQPFENKQFREMPYFVSPMISRTCDSGAKRLISLAETEAFVFGSLFRLVEARRRR
jgi:hypothetical protein